MLTMAVEKAESASGNIFNCVSDRAVTLDGMARLCAKAAGLDVEIIHYDPKAVGVDAKKAFPFRTTVLVFLPEYEVSHHVMVILRPLWVQHQAHNLVDKDPIAYN